MKFGFYSIKQYFGCCLNSEHIVKSYEMIQYQSFLQFTSLMIFSKQPLQIDKSTQVLLKLRHTLTFGVIIVLDSIQ